MASFGFTINKQKLTEFGLPTPQKWTDLASPDFAVTLPTPSVGVADAIRSTSNTRMYEIILQIYGWEEGWKIITLMGANARIYDESGLVRDAVIRGDIAVGITIDFYGYTAQLENPEQCQYVLPADGSIVNGDPIALVVTSKHPEAAQAFIAWVLSAEGQTIWMHPKVNRMPVNPKVFETSEGQARQDLKQAYERTLSASSIEFSDELALSYEEAMRWFFHATITRPHDKLQEVWRELALAYLMGKITKEQFEDFVNRLTNPTLLKFKDPETGKELTFTQEVAQMANKKIMKSPDYRNALVRAWSQAAEERYTEILNELKSLIG
ncbi:MAG TPA: extracellular solute-binding protein [Acidilobales archaeon]|nr:extracellular solute-binding protein [Acidilobales archaeon]